MPDVVQNIKKSVTKVENETEVEEGQTWGPSNSDLEFEKGFRLIRFVREKTEPPGGRVRPSEENMNCDRMRL